ncbi:MAG: VanZ family protein [Eubacteriales bacterium]
MLKGYTGNKLISIKDIYLSIIFSLLLFLCMIPSFSNIGKLLIQIISTIVLSSAVSLISFRFNNGLKVMALALNIFLLILLLSALSWQIVVQIKNYIDGVTYHGWIHMFYYDKLMTIGLVYFSVNVVYAILRLNKIYRLNDSFLKDFINFFNVSGRGFILYYLFFILYSFVIIRGFGSNTSPPNFIPFITIINYIKSQNYEMFMYFLGNLFLFTPLGFYTIVIKPKYHLLFMLLLPITISSAIELSQLIFKNGNCDIDDVILNSIGFYLGVLIKLATDKIISKKTGGSEKTIFVWKPYSIFNYKIK